MKHISSVLTINNQNEIVPKQEMIFGRCTRCGEMTSPEDPCCASVPIEYQGDYILPTFDDEGNSTYGKN